MKYSLIQLEYFYYIYVHGSFAKAALDLGISKSQISQSISKLERALGTKLLHRTTRSVGLTQAGETLIPFVESIIKTKTNIEQEINLLHDEPAGVLRVTCPNAFAECYLAPAIPQFLGLHPNLALDLRLSSNLLDLEKEKIDIAIRLTHEPPLDRIAKQLAHYQLGFFATPNYLKIKGRPKSIDELKCHQCLVTNTVLKGDTWVFEENGLRRELTVTPLLQADNHHVIKKALLKDLGIACLPYFLLQTEIEDEKVIPLLTSLQLPPIPIYAIYASTRKIEAKIKYFLEFLSKLF